MHQAGTEPRLSVYQAVALTKRDLSFYEFWCYKFPSHILTRSRHTQMFFCSRWEVREGRILWAHHIDMVKLVHVAVFKIRQCRLCACGIAKHQLEADVGRLVCGNWWFMCRLTDVNNNWPNHCDTRWNLRLLRDGGPESSQCRASVCDAVPTLWRLWKSVYYFKHTIRTKLCEMPPVSHSAISMLKYLRGRVNNTSMCTTCSLGADCWPVMHTHAFE